ncbi:MAG: purine-nucleoside phosphorylase [Williamsia sp.]|nr:purine-nucleoside phosphorylase [Williamsia sp.]
MTSIIERLDKTVNYIRSLSASKPAIGIVLGSGLGNLIREIEIETEIEYDSIPYFPVSTVEGHHGRLIIGSIQGKPVVVMAGRFHFYEGYTPQDVAYPVRVMKALGVQTLLISNAAGGLNPAFRVGDLMILQDHISLFTINPLLGKNEPELGERFPDMSEPYSLTLIEKGEQIAARLSINVKKGVYAGVTGPTFETRAEYKMLHLLGGDAVGMSTVQEVIVARHAGLQVFAMSVITDIGIREELNTITHEEVLQAAREAEPKLTSIFLELVKQL